MDSCLFRGLDPSGNHETPSQHAYVGLASDVVDIDVVVKYLKSKFGYVVTMMVSHSRGSMVTMRYLCTFEDAANVKYLVNVSGRYRMVSKLARLTRKLRFTKLRPISTLQKEDRRRYPVILFCSTYTKIGVIFFQLRYRTRR